MIELDGARPGNSIGKQRAGIVGIADLAVSIEQGEHALDVGQRLANLAVEHAEVVERHVELDQEGIDQHDVAHRHAPGGDTDGGTPHHQRDTAGDDQRLAEIEPGQRDLAPDLRYFPFLHLFVITGPLPGFVVEVFYRLEIDQAIDGTDIGRRIELIHRAAQVRAPVADDDGEDDVGDERDEGDQAEIPGIAIEQNTEHQRDLEQRRQDRIQRVGDQRTDRAGAAFDVAGESPGLAFEMEAQGERVQMLEDLQGDGAHRLLGDPGEKDLAQLGK